MTRLWIKVCGITTVDDANAAVDAGVDAIGLNLIPTSRRAIDLRTARKLSEAVAERVAVVAVIADLTSAASRELRTRSGIEWLQLHGQESPERLRELLPQAFKAVAIGGPRDVAEAELYAGDRVLVDTKVAGTSGGTGKAFDWSLVEELAKRRRLVLAGGLNPENVEQAVSRVRPFGIDVASGVEQGGDPRRKDPNKLLEFVKRARSAE